MTSEKRQPLVSVHMPVFNGEETIEKALRSLRLQTHENWEAVIVNDGSKDRTREIVQSVNDARFRLIDLPENRGRAYARQVALENSTGDFIAYLDCDDFYHPAKLERQLDYFYSFPEVSYCGCGFGSLDLDGSLRRVRGKKSIEPLTFRFGDVFPFAPAVSMIRTDVAEACSYNTKMRLGEDTDYFSRALRGEKYGAISDVLYFYREYGSITLKKILSSYCYQLFLVPSYFTISKKYSMKIAAESISKLIVMSVLGLVVPIDRIIDKRGQQPVESDVQFLKETLIEMQMDL